jgi:amino acid transporter
MIGQPAWVLWICSVSFGFLQSFVYAEIAGLYPQKSGGASIYGAAAWIPYAKLIGPISVWCNWLAWSPTMALGTGVAAGYVVNAAAPADSAFARWQLTIADLSAAFPGLTIRINAVSIIATTFLLITFYLQHRGVARAALTQKLLAYLCLFPLLVVGIIPLISGRVAKDNLVPLLPLVRDAMGDTSVGSWGFAVIPALAASMFAAGWATYGFETAVCYTRELRDPRRDTFKAILAAGLLCIATFSLVPLAFQGALGIPALLNPSIQDGTGVAAALATIVNGGQIVQQVFIVLFVMALLLITNSSMMGSSRTLYQASVDGWLPRYLGTLNQHGVPARAMWTDLGFNILLLLMSDYFVILVVSNGCYLLFNFLNLQAGWIHRIDRGDWDRPYRCPTWLLALGAILGFVNMVFVGAGADVLRPGAILYSLIATALIIPIFVWRHYVKDKGVFPGENESRKVMKRAGWLPYAAVAACAAVVALSHLVSTRAASMATRGIEATNSPTTP